MFETDEEENKRVLEGSIEYFKKRIEEKGLLWYEEVLEYIGFSKDNVPLRTYYWDKDGFKNVYDNPIESWTL